MAKGHKPVAGSRAFWPRKRAKKIYSRPKAHPQIKEAVPLDFAGYKAGMTQISFVDTRKGSVTEGQEIVRPVSVLECPPLVVCGIKVYKKTPYGLKDSGTVWSEKLSKDLKRKTRIPKDPKPELGKIEKELENIAEIRLLVHTKPRESGIGKKSPELFELSLGGKPQEQFEYAKQKLGQEIKVSEVFRDGELVDVRSVSKGKGYQGVVKRFGVRIRTRKAKLKRRHIGVMAPRTPARVRPGLIAQAGQMGFQTRTEYNKKILKIGTVKETDVNPKGGFLSYGLVKGDYILLDGSVPGTKKRLIMLRKGVRISKEASTEPIEIKKIMLESQQGV